jgi:hypothetical protein
MKIRPCSLLSVIFLAFASFAQSPLVANSPPTPKRAVTDEYNGVKVVDDYRWLENWDDPEVKQWSAAQNTLARAYLDHLPARSATKDRLHQLISAGSDGYYDLHFRGGTLFALRFRPTAQQPALVAMRLAHDPSSAKVIFDPNTASAKGSLSMDFYVPSFDGKYVAIALSENGSEDSAAHVIEVATGKELGDVVPRVNFPPPEAASTGRPTGPASTTRAIRRETNVLPRMPTSISKSTFTSWPRTRSRTPTLLARLFHALPKSSFAPATTEDGSSHPSRMAMAANSPIM